MRARLLNYGRWVGGFQLLLAHHDQKEGDIGVIVDWYFGLLLKGWHSPWFFGKRRYVLV